MSPINQNPLIEIQFAHLKYAVVGHIVPVIAFPSGPVKEIQLRRVHVHQKIENRSQYAVEQVGRINIFSAEM